MATKTRPTFHYHQGIYVYAVDEIDIEVGYRHKSGWFYNLFTGTHQVGKGGPFEEKDEAERRGIRAAESEALSRTLRKKRGERNGKKHPN